MTTAGIVVAAGLALATSVVSAADSAVLRVRVNDAAFSFWRVLPNEDFDLHFDFPDGARSAELTITGGNRRKVIGGLSTSPFLVTRDLLPGAGDDGENVFSFRLAFDTGETLSADGLARVAGTGSDSARLRVRLGPADAAPWTSAGRYNVLPVPAGTGTLVVGDDAIPWTGVQGWYLLGPLSSRSVMTVALDDAPPVSLARMSGYGMQVIVR